MKGKLETACKLTIYILLLLSFMQLAVCSLYNPYKILGVDRRASNYEIRKAYKQLAKEWHPDKSNLPEAEQKFVEIKQAYEILNDPERRRLYDQHGISDEESYMYRKQQQQQREYTQFRHVDPIEEFFGHFNFDEDIGLYHKMTISAKNFEQNVLPKSHTVPHFIVVYSDWCFRCMRLVAAVKKLIEHLEPLGIHFSAINAAQEPKIMRRLGVSDVPSMVMMLNGHSYIYRDSSYSIHKVIEFIRKKLPYKLLQEVNDENVDNFLAGWHDNKVRALVLEPKTQTRLRYLIGAFKFRERIAFGYVRLRNDNTKHIKERYKVHPSLDTLLVFNEDSERPVASVSMSDIPTQTFINIVSSNQYLALPRLSSQEMLEGICPAEWNRPRKRLCVVLITENTNAHNYARDTLRYIALRSVYNPERVRFAYIYQETQTDFINAISQGSSDNKLLRVVVIWRRDISHIKYEWVNGTNLSIEKLPPDERTEVLNNTKHAIDTVVHRLLRTSEALTHEAFVKDLMDEHAQGIFGKWITKLWYFTEYLLDNLEQEHLLASLSLIGTITFMFAIGYLMMYLVRVEEKNIAAEGRSADKNSAKKASTNVPELKLHELRAEKYNGLVRLLKPGCRTIILITDLPSRSKLIPAFHAAVWPYRKNKTLMFGHMLIERGLAWYSELLRLSLSESRDLQINPRNCIGTVIALNGHRKYFCMYHAKHPETMRSGAKRMLKMTRRLVQNSDDPEAGLFLMSDNNSDESETDYEQSILLEENLLDGLSNWLDRLFEGTTHRYYINFWPDFPTK